MGTGDQWRHFWGGPFGKSIIKGPSAGDNLRPKHSRSEDNSSCFGRGGGGRSGIIVRGDQWKERYKKIFKKKETRRGGTHKV